MQGAAQRDYLSDLMLQMLKRKRCQHVLVMQNLL